MESTYQKAALRVLRNAGFININQVIFDGEFHRHATSDKPREHNGAYVARVGNIPWLWWCNWATGQEGTWNAKEGQELTWQEKAELARNMEEAREKRRQEDAERWANAVETAYRITSHWHPADAGFPYLAKKNVQPVRGLYVASSSAIAREYEKAGCGKFPLSGDVLVVPLLAPDGNLSSLQFIDAHGNKLFLKGGRKQGRFFPIGDIGDNPEKPLVVCEGLATGLSVHECTGWPVLVAFDAGNLPSVAQAARERHPERKIILAADNDCETEGNPGVSQAQKAARAIGGFISIPSHEGKKVDWNDLHTLLGKEATGKLFMDGCHKCEQEEGGLSTPGDTAFSDLWGRMEGDTQADMPEFLAERGTGGEKGDKGDLAIGNDAKSCAGINEHDAKTCASMGEHQQALKPQYHCYNIDADFFAMKFPEQRFLFAPIIPERGLCMLHAFRGCGKTYVALSIAHAVATGGTLFGRWKASEPSRVLYVDGEMTIQELQERINALAPDVGPGDDLMSFLISDMYDRPLPNLATNAGQRELEPCLAGIKLVIVDSLATLTDYGDDNAISSWKPMQNWILSLKRRGISVLLVHHQGKGGDQRGTSSKVEAMDTVIRLDRPSDYDMSQDACFEVRLTKIRGGRGKDAEPFEAQLLEDNGKLDWVTCGIDGKAAKRTQAQELKAQGKSLRDIGKELGMSKSAVERMLR